MSHNNTILTSVKIIKDNYNEFRKITVSTEITLQKFVNRAIDMYLNDSEFRKKVDSHETNGTKNSKY